MVLRVQLFIYFLSTYTHQIQSTRTNLPANTYPALVSSIRVVVFNGDWDACVPYTDGEGWTEGKHAHTHTLSLSLFLSTHARKRTVYHLLIFRVAE